MATGRLRFYSQAQNGQVNIAYVIPNDVPEIMTAGNESFKKAHEDTVSSSWNVRK
ncbi:hypothetical protein [Butyrivibrio sp. FCS014]|uniref:hypothetical protein n=1 Tax=Butyrivibrio sp. FCS014 TaxID=1408304 RepID=UPI0004BCE17F|nr:hypothetical protein [Butyrivibrio sp. FCS014]